MKIDSGSGCTGPARGLPVNAQAGGPAKSLSGSPESGGPERPTVSDLANVLSWAQDEAELVTELQSGSDAAFDWLVSYYHAPVYSLALGMLGNVSDGVDVRREVFRKGFGGIGSSAGEVR